MKSKKCPHCEKIIDGFSDHHVEWLLSQHLLTHFKIIDGKLIKKGGKDGKGIRNS